MTELARDFRFALRMLTKNPAFTAAAVITLALGIGLNTAVFSTVHSVFLRPLPGVHEPDRLVQLYRHYSSDFLYGSNSIPHFFSIRDNNDVYESVAAWTFTALNLSEGGENERIAGEMVSADYFRTLGVTPVIGRGFLPEEDAGPGAHPVVVLSHGMWQDRFGGDPDVVGRGITLNGRPFEVVGVMPESFHGAMPAVRSALYAPLMMQRELMPGTDRLENRGSNFMNVVARLKDGVTPEQARQAMDALIAGLAEEHPGQYAESGITLVPQAEAGLHPSFGETQSAMSIMMMAVVGLLLLIACVNVANLFLARARDRQKEMGIRLSIGAGRGRIVRQLLTETLLFAVVAGAAGLALAYGAVAVLNGVRLPFDFPIEFGIAISGPVLLFTAIASLATGLLFGLAPALTASKADLTSALKSESARGGASRSRLSRTLVGVQVALSLVLLISAGLFLRNLQAATTLDKGFAADNLMLVAMDPGLQGYERPRTEELYATLLERVRRYPDVRAAGLAEMVPLGFGSQQWGISVPGYEPAPRENMSIDYNIISPGYFDAMGIPVLRGRAIEERDDANARPVVVVNERFAARFWPGESALGKVVHMGSVEREVVGITPTGRYRSLGEEPLPFIYVPHAQVFNSEMTLHVRTTGAPESVLPRIRQEVARLDPDLPLHDVRSMEGHMGISMLPARLGGIALGVFGVLGLFLAAIGIYGVMAYSVAQRTREIGIRVALGAARSEVAGLVLRQGMSIVLVGTAIGLLGAFGVARLLSSMLYSGSGMDPVTFIAVPAVLLASAALATYLPARRAAAVDPVTALKQE